MHSSASIFFLPSCVDSCLKDGTNTVKTQQKISEVAAAKEDGSLNQNKTGSPFCELYKMARKSLADTKSPWKSTASQPQTPISRFCTPKPVSSKKVRVEDVQSTPKKSESETASDEPEEKIISGMIPESAQKERTSLPAQVAEINAPEEQKAVEDAAVTTPITQKTPKIKRRSSQLETTDDGANATPVSPKEKRQGTPQKPDASEVAANLTVEQLRTPTRRSSKGPEVHTGSVTASEDQATVAVECLPGTPNAEPIRSPRTSPRTAEKRLRALKAATEIGEFFALLVLFHLCNCE